MKKIILVILFLLYSLLSQGSEPMTATTVEVQNWNRTKMEFVTTSFAKCHITIFFLDDRIKMKGGEHDVTYYSRNNSGTKDINGFFIGIMQCYDELGTDCLITILLDKSTNERTMIITYQDVAQFVYTLSDYIPN